MNENINKWDYIKLKCLYIATENTSRGIKKATTFMKIYANNRFNRHNDVTLLSHKWQWSNWCKPKTWIDISQVRHANKHRN